MVGDQQLVPRLERQGTQDCVHARGGIGDEDQVLGRGTHEARQCLTRGIDAVGDFAPHEEHGFALQLSPQTRLFFEHGARARAERTVVQESDPGIEVPMVAQGVLGESLSHARAAPSRRRAFYPRLPGIPGSGEGLGLLEDPVALVHQGLELLA